MSEPHEGDFTLRVGDNQEIECNRDNTSLFTFAGNLACYNHVFVVQEEQPEMNIGLYIFSHNPGFLALHNFLLRNGFPAHLNLRQVSECDINAWNDSAFKDLNESDHIPDEWLGEG